MRLSYFSYGIDIFIEENVVNVLVVENQNVYRELINDLILQSAGNEGVWQLSDGDKDLIIAKSISLVHTPFMLELNSKKNLSYLYKELKFISDEYAYEEMSEINTSIVAFLDKIAQKLPYQLDYNFDLELPQLFKQYDVHIDMDGTSLLEKVLNYIQLEKTLCNTKLLVFMNLRSYFNDEEIVEIYKMASYNKISLFLIEIQKRDSISGEKYCIIDKDKCIITY